MILGDGGTIALPPAMMREVGLFPGKHVRIAVDEDGASIILDGGESTAARPPSGRMADR